MVLGLQVTSRKDQEQYWADRSKPYRYIPVKEFSEAFYSFSVGKRLLDDLSQSYDRTKNHPAALKTTKYGIGRINMLKACFSREWLLMKRNSFVYVFKAAQVINSNFKPNLDKFKQSLYSTYRRKKN